MTWYWWKHWFWITVFIVISTTKSISSNPVSPLEEIKEYGNSKKSTLKYPITQIDTIDDDDIDDVFMGDETIPVTSLLKDGKGNVIELNNKTFTNKKENVMTINQKNDEKKDEDKLRINNNNNNNDKSNHSKNNNNDSNLSNSSSSNGRVIKLIHTVSGHIDDDIVNESFEMDRTVSPTDVISIEDTESNSNFSLISTNKTESSMKNESTKLESNIMQIKKNSTISLQTTAFNDHDDDHDESTTIIKESINMDNNNKDDDDDESLNITKLNMVTTTDTPNFNTTKNTTEKISTKLENVTKNIGAAGNVEQERVRKSKGLSAEYRDDGSSSTIHFSTETKNLLTRSASDSKLFVDRHDDDGNVSSEALQVQRAYFMDAGAISGICVAILAICCGVALGGIVLYRRRYLNKPQALGEQDSNGYIDDSTIRDNSDEMYSLDNDSFLNSLEAMTIQNYWTDTVKHTKL